MMHISVEEAKRHFKRMEVQQKRIKDKAEQEEQKRKEKEEYIISFLNKHSGDFDKLKAEISQPDKNQK